MPKVLSGPQRSSSAMPSKATRATRMGFVAIMAGPLAENWVNYVIPANGCRWQNAGVERFEREDAMLTNEQQICEVSFCGGTAPYVPAVREMSEYEREDED